MIETDETEIITAEPESSESESQPTDTRPAAPATQADDSVLPRRPADAGPPDATPERSGPRNRKVLGPPVKVKLIDRALLRASPGPGAHEVDQAPAGTDQLEPTTTAVSPRDEKQRRNGREVLGPPGKVKLIDRNLLRRPAAP
jgi:hypothetical protein